MSKNIIELKNIRKKYQVNFAKKSLVGSFLSFFSKDKKNRRKNEIFALDGIDILIKKGESVGIIGENASGKTTLLRIISKITFPSGGSVYVNGKVAGLLDLGAGFHSELTGKENIYLDAALYGLNRKEIDKLYPDIVKFSGLDDFINAQVKTYSQGMLVRLGFSIAVHVNPEIFLIDDSLAVGDEEFQRRCIDKISELKKQGKTIIIVSHDLESLSRVCGRGILLKAGKIIKDDSIHKVIMRYVEAVGDRRSIAAIDQGQLSAIFNSGKVILLFNGVALTKNFGGYASLQLSDRWIMSWQMPWEVLASRDNYWKAEGRLNKYGLVLTLECRVENENRLSFTAGMGLNCGISVKKAGFGFMLSDKYDNFLKDDFLQRIDIKENQGQGWEDILRTDEHNAPLIFTGNSDLPAFKVNFQQKDGASFSLVQATDKQLNALVVQNQRDVLLDNLCDANEQFFECRSELQFLTRVELEDFIQKRQEQHAIELGDLKFLVQNKSMRLFYKTHELTKQENIKIGFYQGEHYFDFFDGMWKVQKHVPDSLSLYSEFIDKKFVLEADIRLQEQIIFWQANLKSREYSEATPLIVGFYVRGDYERYFNIYQEKYFPQGTEHAEQVYRLSGEGVFIGLSAEKDDLPSLAFLNGDNAEIELQNAALGEGLRILTASSFQKPVLSGAISIFSSTTDKDRFINEKKQEKGLNVLQSKDNGIRLEFGSNKVAIFQEDQELTAGEGLSTGIFFNGRWHESKQLAKEFRKEGSILKVLIKRNIPKVNELWNISFEKTILRWNVELEASESVEAFMLKAGVVLKPDFINWAHAFDSGTFLAKKSQQVIDLDDKNNKLLGAKAENAKLPALFFERKSKNKLGGIIIQNSETESCFQFKFQGSEQDNDDQRKKIFHSDIRLLTADDWQNNVSTYQSEHYSLTGSDGLKLFVIPQQVQIFFGREKLTLKDGIRISLVTDNGDVSSYYGNWNVTKINKDEIVIRIKWPWVPLEEKWSFRRCADAILWKAELIVKEMVLLKDAVVHIFTGPDFNRWLTRENSGEVNLLASKKDSVTVFDNRSDFICLYKDEKENNNPAFFLEPFLDMNKWHLHISRYQDEPVIAFGMRNLIKPEGEYLGVGTHEIFKANIFLKSAGSTPKEHRELINFKSRAKRLNSGKVRLDVSPAKAEILWDKQKITNALCMYTAFFDGNNWINSNIARWQVNDCGKNIQISLFWNELFVAQNWRIEFVKEHEIFWDIETRIKQKGVNALTAGLMLVPGFDCYQAEMNNFGVFAEAFKKDDWPQLYNSSEEVCVFSKNKSLPKIIFKGAAEGNYFLNAIENTDLLHSSRLLKCEFKTTKNMSDDTRKISAGINIIFKEQMCG